MAGVYASGTSQPTWATWRHQSSGARHREAPRDEQERRRALGRERAHERQHRVAVALRRRPAAGPATSEPSSSLSAISGFAQAVEACAFCTSAAATASMVAGSAGAVGRADEVLEVHLPVGRRRSGDAQRLGHVGPVEATVTPGRANTAWRNATEPSENSTGSGPVGFSTGHGPSASADRERQRENGNEHRGG